MNAESASAWIGYEVITESGVPLGWVKNTNVGNEDDYPHSLVISLLPYLWLPNFLTGSYELSTSEIIYDGPNRLIAFEEAEQKLITQTVSWFERIGLLRPPWHQNYEEIYPIVCTKVYEHEEDTWNDDGDLGSSPIPAPRKPGPNPLSGEAEIPID